VPAPSRPLLTLILVIMSITATGCLPGTKVSSMAGVAGYRAWLERQEGEPERLTGAMITRLQPHFTTSLDQVRIHSGIDTISGKVVTFGKDIYFPSKFLMDDEAYLRRLLHEIKHVDQQSSDGLSFMPRYLTQAGSSNLASGINAIGITGVAIVDTHANWKYEAEARAAETEVFEKLNLPCFMGKCSRLQ